jgi:N-acetylmuramoyl-L-alanine amidase
MHRCQPIVNTHPSRPNLWWPSLASLAGFLAIAACGICEVVREGSETPPCQFSYWCDGKRDEPTEGESWRLASAVATELLSAPPPDPAHGAIFYHRDGIRPAWSTKHRRTAQVGRHFFYR